MIFEKTHRMPILNSNISKNIKKAIILLLNISKIDCVLALIDEKNRPNFWSIRNRKINKQFKGSAETLSPKDRS